ncbi:MAG: acyl-CoA thioesterase II [Actinobacteria bacterium]|nr:acyl-CoA thioesterase II [Actinomycetota bacterium]
MNPRIPENPLAEMISTLDLESISNSTSKEDLFQGPSQWMPHGRVFGGQVLAQSLVAASRTVENRAVHSMHGYFLRPGDINLPITYSVDRLRDGRSFGTRRVQAFQKDEPIFSMIASFQEHDPGLEHQDEFPNDIPDPETLPSAADLMGDNPHPVAQYWSKARPFDMRHVGSPIYFKVEGKHVAHQAVWLRSLGAMPDDQNLHTAALAYASDYSILESSYRQHGIAWSHPGLKSASLDHAMWFHRPARVDEWMLYVQESPSAQGGRGLALGKIFNTKGELLATVAQEGMVRVPELAK